MAHKILSDDEWMEGKILLESGWYVNTKDSLYFVAPDGVIYDRCGWMLTARGPELFSRRFPHSLHLTDIFTDEEFESYNNS